MIQGWKRRVLSAAGVMVFTAIAVLIANHPLTQAIVTIYVPLARRLPVIVLEGSELVLAIALSCTIVFLCLIPLYKPGARQILDLIFLTEKRVLAAIFALATVSYFNWTYRLPRATLAVTTGPLLVVLPTWFVLIKTESRGKHPQVIIVGDDPHQINRAAAALKIPVLGYVSSPTGARSEATPTDPIAISDSGPAAVRPPNLELLGGLSRLKQILTEYDMSTVVLAFRRTDRGEFFGVLETCHAHGVEAKVLREHADSVLLSDETAEELVTIALGPWDWQDRLIKRGFDTAFAVAGLVLFAPLLGLIALMIKLDSPGPVFYGQKRTADLRSTFEVLKFRTMYPDSESVGPVDDENNDQITRVGRLLRKSHLDELPQLWAILIGDMSVVGPRAVWTSEESLLEERAVEWRKRWFVKPGLTGLAQINDVSSTNPKTKLRHDLKYIRRQSFWLDVKIVIRQIWMATTDVIALVRNTNPKSR